MIKRRKTDCSVARRKALPTSLTQRSPPRQISRPGSERGALNGGVAEPPMCVRAVALESPSANSSEPSVGAGLTCLASRGWKRTPGAELAAEEDALAVCAVADEHAADTRSRGHADRRCHGRAEVELYAKGSKLNAVSFKKATADTLLL